MEAKMRREEEAHQIAIEKEKTIIEREKATTKKELEHANYYYVMALKIQGCLCPEISEKPCPPTPSPPSPPSPVAVAERSHTY
jgi:hypothetical protein